MMHEIYLGPSIFDGDLINAFIMVEGKSQASWRVSFMVTDTRVVYRCPKRSYMRKQAL